MNREEREVYIQKTMLKVLSEIGPYLLPLPAFFAQINLMVMPPVLVSEFAEQLTKLQQKNWILGIRDEFNTIKFKLTENGRAILAEENL